LSPWSAFGIVFGDGSNKRFMRIIFAGSGEFGLPTLKALEAAGHEIAAVFTQPDRPAGRGSPTPIGEFSIQRGFTLTRTQDLNDEKLPDADLMIVIAFGQKIGPEAVSHPRLGSVNLHSSRLPKYRGAAPINWAILRGETETGNSIIRLAQKMDAGAILAQSRVPIDELETAGELHDRLSRDGVDLMLRTVADLETGRVIETPQDESAATLAPKLNRQSAAIDWAAPPPVVARQIRGLYPWPGCRVRVCRADGTELSRMTLVRARVGPSEGDRWSAGEVEGSGLVRTADGAIEVLEVQPEGRKAMALLDYRRGNVWVAGLRLVSVV
jgi:methionyl-tRNA formyltransferase